MSARPLEVAGKHYFNKPVNLGEYGFVRGFLLKRLTAPEHKNGTGKSDKGRSNGPSKTYLGCRNTRCHSNLLSLFQNYGRLEASVTVLIP